MKIRPDFKALIISGVAAFIATGALADSKSMPAESPTTERCYGISRAGNNACYTPRHACAGLSTRDNDPGEWALVPKGTCQKRGGKTSPG